METDVTGTGAGSQPVEITTTMASLPTTSAALAMVDMTARAPMIQSTS